MSALILGMLVVVCCVLVFRLHAFLALFAGALVVAACTTPQQIQSSLLDSSTARVIEQQEPFAITLDDVGDDWSGRPGEYVVLPTTFAPTSNETVTVLVEKVEQEGDLEVAYLSKAHSLPDDFTNARLVSRSQFMEANRTARSSEIGRVATAFGKTCTKIGILIAMASIIGRCLLVSGAAERIVVSIRQVMGEDRTALAFVVSSFVLSIPVFFDTVFFLMLPLAQAMARRTGRDYLKYVLSIVVGGTLAHSLVPPTPGPLFVASELNVGIGTMVLGGIGIGFWGVLAGYFYMLWANGRWEIPLRMEAETTGLDEGEDPDDSDSKLPGFWPSVLPVLIPVVLLGANTFAGTFIPAENSPGGEWRAVLSFFGDKNIALSTGAVFALLTLLRSPGMKLDDVTRAVQRALGEGGVVILITCAGGAFGEMIRQTNVGATIASTLPSSGSGAGLLLTAFLITAVIRVVQGSATVAMITSIGIVAPIAAQVGLPFHPVYLALAIGCGSKPLPWMNDSGFWVISRMSGFTEMETLKTFSVLLTIMGIVSFCATLVAAMILPLQ
ncbi:GntP family permease [Calycomorphotria hydatis]|uniref:Low-affinity gluconate transporter n=1 Tax=Calycomorphotria hydatis TaxID=2528027 RepID=A0A517TEJ4_9PLAN|nr:SLC13 family permease [Calycomorphotria hydatis]QDT66793.1 Low-affinity gluconate transporter [Calycomorphotria hydatis]